MTNNNEDLEALARRLSDLARCELEIHNDTIACTVGTYRFRTHAEIHAEITREGKRS